ncbi:PilZ domain-containing protein [Acidithiobacillus thiooxidans]|uniref:PilZ domain-containing protein n=1 Tax=Acidithiobacillus thiooxidans TaxID=930 RepID=UPI00049475B5|nr:PilZ domain-containing protein [Acidithiobacillus thiooxidans]MBU2810276.1 PilZ domain-containing protein [Acidithiobacillus thiooxidans]
MSLTADDSELALLMPQRAGMPLMEYLSLVFLAGAEDLLRPALEQLEIQAGQSVLIYGPDPRDDGQLCHFQEWDMEALVLQPATLALGELPEYHKALIFVLARPWLLGFFADWKYFREGAHHFQCPQRVLRRQARKEARMRIEGHIIIRRKRASGLTTVLANLYDFSASGASFYTDQMDFAENEMFLVEFEIPNCGTCETIATTARVETLSHSIYGYLVGIHFELTEVQRKKAQNLYLCQKAEQIQQLSDTRRHRWAPPQKSFL